MSSIPLAMRAFNKPQLAPSTRLLLSKSSHQPAQRAFASNTSSSRTTWQTTWKRAQHQHQHQQTRGYRQPLNYQRFKATSSLFRRWAQHPRFYYHVAGIGGTAGGIYVYNLEEVPVSHRRRFNIVGKEKEAAAGQMMFQQTMQQYGNQLLPAYHPKSRMVRRVLDRLIPHSGLQDEEWEVHVINDPMKNAFVIPGGKVFVFSGILDICQDDDGLAAVLGHEIAHNVAHHAAERMSKSNILLGVVMAGFLLIGIDPGIGNLLTEFAFTRPGSRSQESEADYIGLLMMAESCYRPEAAMDLWARMEEAEGGQNAPPQFMSTHPSNHNRLEQIRGWMPEAEAKRDGSECSSMNGFGEFLVSSCGDVGCRMSS
jgi:predicted Zn-dependent protease